MTEQEISEQWAELRDKERDAPGAVKALLPGRPSSLQSKVIEVLDRELTTEDIGNRLRVRHGVDKTPNGIGANLSNMWRRGMIAKVATVERLPIWGPVT